MNHSRDKRKPRFLGAARIERLLGEWANIPDPHTQNGDDAIARLIRRYPDLFPPSDRKLKYEHWGTVQGVRHYLIKAWNISDPRERDWYIFKARDNYKFAVVDMPVHRKLPKGEIPDEDIRDALPPDTLLEQAMVYFQRNSDRARRCPNADCPAPYFFAPRKKKRQRYCSVKCAKAALLKQKRDWWRENRGIGGS
jgi:hypothetical protein